MVGLVCLFWLMLALGQSDGQDISMQDLNPRMPPKLRIDEERVAANGIRKLSGRHVDLYTDIRGRQDIDELVLVFDLAIKEWCDYFNVDIAKTKNYRLSGFVIEDRQRFQNAGLIPPDVPNFLAGFNRGHEMWLYLKPGDYYTRHLWLHEGTHAFMQWYLGNSGPPWYSEGMAELLALLEWKDGRLTLNFRATDRDQVPYWGRPKIIREAREIGRLLDLQDVFALRGPFNKVDGYAWSWAACDFLGRHPLTQEAFSNLPKKCSDITDNFSIQFLKAIEDVHEDVNREWHLFLNEHDYGTDSARVRIYPAESDNSVFSVRADRGWQTTGINVRKGDQITLKARGRFQIASTTQTWPSEAGGVTLDYHRGQPVGKLIAGVLNPQDLTSLNQSLPVGLRKTLTIETEGILCLRINDSPANMDDNQGELEVLVERK